MSISNERGLELERAVRHALETMATAFPTSFSYEYQPTIKTHLGYEYRPDFRVEVMVPPFGLSFFVECQRRHRVGANISEKIDAMRLRSQFNLFVFVYDGLLPDGRRRYMQDGGTTCQSRSEFFDLLASLQRTLQVLRVAALPSTGLLRLGFFGD
jgi:hypothetical protein